ncbi:hypothetical protein RRG08_013767, partial [Elysia crispata]
LGGVELTRPTGQVGVDSGQQGKQSSLVLERPKPDTDPGRKLTSPD